MSLQEVNIVDQESQQMEIAQVAPDYLLCKFTGEAVSEEQVNARVALSALLGGSTTVNDYLTYYVKVSRPIGLRKSDLGDDWQMLSGCNKRSGIGGDNTGTVETLNPPYLTGDLVMVTKKISDSESVDTTSKCLSEAIKDIGKYTGLSSPWPTFEKPFKFVGANGGRESKASRASRGHVSDGLDTADFMMDENRAGRSWSVAGSGSGGMPEGYSPKCVAFCENGETVSGQILFKPGCDDVTVAQPTGPLGTGPYGTGPDGTGPDGTGPDGTAPGGQGTGPGGGGGGGAGTGGGMYRVDDAPPGAVSFDFMPL